MKLIYNYWVYFSIITQFRVIVAVPIVAAGFNFNQDTWSKIQSGNWLIELYSPYCPHCVAFAPTWKEIFDQRSATDSANNFFMGQVNCAENGDLCSSQGVTHYPSLFLYENGVLSDKYEGSRDLKSIGDYIAQHTSIGVVSVIGSAESGYKQTPTIVTGKIEGVVHVLEREHLINLKKKGAAPSFVKYYAPWCGHCKTFAPNLATLFADSVDFYDLDCSNPQNKKTCEIEKVRGYPTLIFYNLGRRVEFNDQRNLKELVAFVSKSLDLTQVKTIEDQLSLENAVKSHDVLVLFFFSSNTMQEEIDLVDEISGTLVGSTPYYTSTSAELFAQFAQTDESCYIVFKDHSILPSQVFKLPSNNTSHRYSITTTWLRLAKLPTLIELSASTYHDVMLPLKHSPFLVVILLDPNASNYNELSSKAKGLAVSWKGHKSKSDISKNVIFVWIDCERWKDWISSMYKLGERKLGVHGVVLVVDPYTLNYWSIGIDGGKLSLYDDSVYHLIESGIATGLVIPSNSKKIIQQLSFKIYELLEFNSESAFWIFISLVVTVIVLGLVWKQWNCSTSLSAVDQLYSKIE